MKQPVSKSEFLQIQRDSTGRVTKDCCDAFRKLLEEQAAVAMEIVMAQFTSMRPKEYEEICIRLKVKIQE
jgi:hypothetical protein